MAPSGGLSPTDRAYRRTVLAIVALIATLAVGQSLYALSIGNRFLLKDGIDWIYDVVLWLVALAVFGRGLALERLAALGVAAVMAVAGLHTGYDLWDKIATGRRPEVWVAGWSALSAIAIGLIVVAAMFRFRHAENPLVAATWLTSRNDAIATTAFALVGFAARVAPSQWPEILLDLFVIGLSFQAVWAIVAKVRKSAPTPPADGGQGGAEAASSGSGSGG